MNPTKEMNLQWFTTSKDYEPDSRAQDGWAFTGRVVLWRHYVVDDSLSITGRRSGCYKIARSPSVFGRVPPSEWDAEIARLRADLLAQHPEARPLVDVDGSLVLRVVHWSLVRGRAWETNGYWRSFRPGERDPAAELAAVVHCAAREQLGPAMQIPPSA